MAETPDSKSGETRSSDEALVSALRDAVDATVPGGNADALLPPRQIGAYRILSILGAGGMGIVYEAEQQDPRRPVALKVVRGGHHVDEHHVRLFQREAQTLARLKHPGIAAIYESGRTEDGQHFFAMELLRGSTLKEHVEAKNLPARERLQLFCQICEAINYAHQRGVIHRDLKPSNILIDGVGTPKVLDFGLARITDADVYTTTLATQAGCILGTLAYMSPEQARGNPDEIDLRSDIYSLGVILFELVTGRFPYDVNRSALHEAVRAICEEAPLRPSAIDRTLRGDLETIILKALEKEPSRRYQSASAFAEDIQRVLGNQPIMARPPSTLYQLRKLILRHKVPFALAGILLVAAIATAIRMVQLAERAEKFGQLAETEARSAEHELTFLLDLIDVSDPNQGKAQFIDARLVLDEAAKRIEEKFSAFPSIRAKLLMRSAVVYRNRGHNALAVKLLEKAMTSCREAHGKEHKLVADCLTEIGWTQKLQGDLAQAEDHLNQARKMFERLPDPDPILVAKNLHVLGTLQRSRGRLSEAIDLLESAVDLKRQALGPAHVDVGDSLTDLAESHRRNGSHAEAKRLVQHALVAYGQNPEGRWARSLLGSLLHEEGDYAGAADKFEQSHRVLTTSYDKDHAYVVSALTWLGKARRDQGSIAAAEEALVEAEQIQTENDPAGDTLMTASVKNNLAWLRFDQGDSGEAERLFLEALGIYRRKLGDNHAHLGGPKIGLAHVRLAGGDVEEANRFARSAMAVYEAAYGEDHWQLASAKSIHGACLAQLGRNAEAEALLIESYRVMKQRRGADDRYVRECAGRLYNLYAARNQTEKAAIWRSRMKHPN